VTTVYSARVVPMRQPTVFPDDHGRPRTFVFDEFNFSRPARTLGSRYWAYDVPVLLNHDFDLEIGRTRELSPTRDWWVATLEIDDSHDITFEPGQNVSIGLKWFNDDTTAPRMAELSIVRHGRVPGAEIVSWVELPPEPRISPPAARGEDHPPVAAPRQPDGEVIQHAATVVYRHPVSARHAEEDAELRRRLDWVERMTGRYPLEEVVAGMQRELNGPSLDDLARTYGKRAA